MFRPTKRMIRLTRQLPRKLVVPGDPLYDESLVDFANQKSTSWYSCETLASSRIDPEIEDISKRIKDLGLEDDLINHKGLTPGMLVTLGEQKILKLADFADLASDELTGGFDVIKGERVKIQGYLEDFALSKEEADNLIMSARKIIYKD